jgi:hypothetical protein
VFYVVCIDDWYNFFYQVLYRVDAMLANAATDAKRVISGGFRFVQPSVELIALIEQHANNVDRYSR